MLFVTRWIDLRPGGTNTTNTFRFIFTFRAWLMPRLPFAMLFAGKIKIIQCITKHKTKALNYFFQYYQYVTTSWSRKINIHHLQGLMVWPLPILLKKFHFNRVIIFFEKRQSMRLIPLVNSNDHQRVSMDTFWNHRFSVQRKACPIARGYWILLSGFWS